jgi:predicted PurR-regulated permease PerM
VNQNWLVTVFFFVLLLVILYVAYLIFSPFLQAVAWAAILAMIVYPVYEWLLKVLKGRATLASLILTILIVFLIVVPAMRVSVFLSQETVELAKTMRSSVSSTQFEALKARPWVQRLIESWESVAAELEFFDIDLGQSAAQGAQVASGFLASQITDVAQNVFLFAVNFVIALFTLFFMLRDGKVLVNKIHSLLPMDQVHKDHLFQNIVNALFAVIHGALITAIIQGLLAGLGYWMLDVPFAIVLAVTTAFTALFPIGGSFLVWFPTALYLGFVQGSMWQGIALFLWGALIVGSIDNFLKPILIGNRLRLPVLILFFSILGGLKLFGIIGLILGPMIVTLLFALLDL